MKINLKSNLTCKIYMQHVHNGKQSKGTTKVLMRGRVQRKSFLQLAIVQAEASIY